MGESSVWYKGEEYVILYKYDSGYWEIRSKESKYVKLVYYSDLDVTPIQPNNKSNDEKKRTLG